MQNDFITIDTLTTFTGIVLAVNIIVQFTKSVIKRNFQDYVIRLYSFIIALILTFVFVPFEINIKGILLNIINAVLVTLTSTGVYETIADPFAEKSKNS